jgi:type I restriction enzyme S subunit
MYGIVLPGPHVDDGVPIVKGGNCEPGKLKLELLSRTSREIESGYERSRLREGDIVYAIRGSIGSAQIVPASVDGANITQDAARIAPKPGVNVRWLLYAVQSAPFFAKLEAGALGATIKGINIRDLKRADIPELEPREQAQIADYLDEQTQRFDSLIGRIGDGIERLQEYRTALISAAVTGQIDVREDRSSK